MSHPRESAAFNARRYKWVRKKIERSDVVAGAQETIVYNLGTLYGEWPDGTPFEGNRYVDRFVVRDGRIIVMDVWNDSAEPSSSATASMRRVGKGALPRPTRVGKIARAVPTLMGYRERFCPPTLLIRPTGCITIDDDGNRTAAVGTLMLGAA